MNDWQKRLLRNWAEVKTPPWKVKSWAHNSAKLQVESQSIEAESVGLAK